MVVEKFIKRYMWDIGVFSSISSRINKDVRACSSRCGAALFDFTLYRVKIGQTDAQNAHEHPV